MVEGIIYRYISPSGKSYIGLTTDEQVRRQHWCLNISFYAGRKINRARLKYGIKNFTYEVLERKLYSSLKEASEDLDKLELFYIQKYDSYNNGYNCTLGGESTRGYKHTKESIDKMSKSKLGKKPSKETREKLSKARRGKSFSISHKKHLSESLKKVKHTWRGAKEAQKVILYHLDGLFINEYNSILDASNYTHINVSAIYKCLSGANKTSGGFIWKYKN